METLKILTKLCIFQKSPADLPYSNLWLGLIVGIHLLATVPLNFQGSISKSDYFLATVCSLVLLIVGIYLLLRMRKLLNRFHKCLMAYLGIELIFLLFGTLLLSLASNAQLLSLFVLLWLFAVKVRLLSISLNVQQILGLLIAINLELVRNIPYIVLFMPILTKAGAI